MRKIESYAELSERITRHFRRGVLTNAFLSRSDWENEIAHGTLACCETESALLAFRLRETHRILQFWLHDGFFEQPPEIPQNTTLEILHRESDTALANLATQWQNLGFAPCFTRQRMVSTADSTATCVPVREALPAEWQDVQTMLRENFSPLTGCLPDEESLQSDIASGGVLAYVADSTLLGVLHYTADKRRTELRHLCVTQNARGQGVGDALVKAYLARTNGLTRHVWVRRDYAPAVKIYTNNGFTNDGMTSTVLLKR